MEADPYLSPSRAVYPQGDAAVVTDGVLYQLAGTKPWVRFFSVLVFIGAAVMLLAAAAMLLAGAASLSSASAPGMRSFGGFGLGASAIYGVIALVYIIPGIKLWKYANGIAILLRSRATIDLEAALDQQRSFWKIIGIMMISMLLLYLLMMIAFFFVGAAAVMQMKP